MRILTNSVDKLPVLVTVLLKRGMGVSGLPAGTPIEVVDDPQAEDIRVTLGTVEGYKGDAYKTLSPKQIVTNPQSVLFLAQALQYGYLGPVDPGLELGRDWVIWEARTSPSSRVQWLRSISSLLVTSTTTHSRLVAFCRLPCGMAILVW